ncbi:unnamed protein product [Kuraishia capsulata CBS 1993]|uniref:Ribosomal protein mS38 C-terminal domain-containing protein n=1 Tax=Kuraishia capsulata CBS 1993 TaxID=1382522 RepID=W6MG99_9ASCO|nr:uncharacterized protein KUCA_T00000456001 [Kuraishia capsulata CBS 1993]CDK24493.1 unnamed protein product [Kuraishia capsulata CBS 1993]
MFFRSLTRVSMTPLRSVVTGVRSNICIKLASTYIQPTFSSMLTPPMMYKNIIREKFVEPESEDIVGMSLDSVKRKRKLKMKKHKLRKRRKAQRALRIRLNK